MTIHGITLKRCTPMSANITEAQCHKNMLTCFSCRDCTGLVEIEEKDDMPSPRGYCNTCKRDDRPLIHKTSEECHSCYRSRKYPKAEPMVVKSVSLPPLPVVEPAPPVLPPNWGKVPCEYCGKLLDFGHDCDCAISADDEPEPIALYEHGMSTQIIPENIPDRITNPLLAHTGFAMVFPDELSDILRARGVSADNIIELVERGLNGRLYPL